MSLGHSEVSFNHSCLKVPVDSSSRRPAPKYERASSGKIAERKQERDKKEFPLSNLYNNFKSAKSYLEFYASIPDYSELHHLSNEEFYSRLRSLKITQKRFCDESAPLGSTEAEDDSPVAKFSCSSFGKSDVKKEEPRGICVCCSVCSPDKDYCSAANEFYDGKTGSKEETTSVAVKRPPPKISITSDNENVSDFYETEFKKHSGYEADRESSNLQPGEKPRDRNKTYSSVNHPGDECLLGDCSRRSRSLPVSPACECDTPEFCHRFSDMSYRNEGCQSNYCFSEKVKQSLKKPKKLHSRPVPLTSRIPLFDKIMMEKEARRRIIHDRYSEELRSLVKPFSFTKREEEKERLRLFSSNPELTSLNPPLVRFKAKPIPKHLFSNYAYERMKEDEFYRALKKRIRAEEMLKSSSLPPSMALREKKFRSKSLDFLDYRSPKKSWNKASGYRRTCNNIKKEIEFDEKLKCGTPQKKKHRSGWMFSNRRINSATDSSTEVSPYESILEPESRRKGRPHSAFSSSRNNLASVLRIETARKRLEREMEEKLRENRQKAQARFKARIVRMNPAWRALSYDKNEDLALRMAARREEERLKKENHQRLMESMYGRVYQMPPLFHKERFFSKLKRSANEKDSVTLSYNDSVEKTDDGCQNLEEVGKSEKPFGFSSSSGHHDDCRRRELSESTASGEKNEKKAYESDDTMWHNEA